MARPLSTPVLGGGLGETSPGEPLLGQAPQVYELCRSDHARPVHRPGQCPPTGLGLVLVAQGFIHRSFVKL